MILKLCKKINQKDAIRIKEINRKIVALRQLQDGLFLKEDLEQKNLIWKSENKIVDLLLDEKIGPVVSSSKCKMERTNSNLICFREEERNMEKLNFSIMLSKTNYPVSDNIVACASVENLMFHTIDIYIDPISAGTFGNIYSLATYFYNKLDAYVKIHACLIKNAKKLEKQISKPYISDLEKLFSVSSKIKNVKDFCISEEFIDKTVCTLNIPSTENKSMALAEYLYYVQGHLVKNVEICLCLGERNTLEYYIIPNTGVEIQEDQELLDFLNNNTNDWLKNLEEMVFFGYSIGKKVKTKLLTSNI